MAKKPEYQNEADYVVVGSGCSGAAIAGRLAESGASVIVLEAGKSDEKFLIKKPGMIGPMHSVPEIKKTVDWGFYSMPQKHILDRKMPVPRGKVVGGSSSINGMVYVRGNRANFDAWAAEGNIGWDADSVNAAYKRMEDFEDGENAFRGAGGPIKVTRNKCPQEGSLQFLQATADATGCEILDDYNGESQEGVSRMQQNAADGLRYSASRGYIHNLAPATLQLQSRDAGPQGRHRERPGDRRRGHRLSKKGGGATRTIRAGKEVILSAGFVGSAQILMLSGVGHAQHLKDHGIDVVADLPVGDNLHDHMFHALTFHVHARARTRARRRTSPGASPRRSCGRARRSWPTRSSRCSPSSRPRRPTDVPDLQLHLLPWAYVSPNQDEPIRHDVDKRTSLTVLTTLIYPKSRGTLRLASADPTAAPLIDFQYLADPADLEVLGRGLRDGPRDHGRLGVQGLDQGGDPPGHRRCKGQELRDAILNRATSVYHGVGTCRMGVDELAVVGPGPQGPRRRGPAGLRRLDHAVDHRRQHQRARHHDRRDAAPTSSSAGS